MHTNRLVATVVLAAAVAIGVSGCAGPSGLPVAAATTEPTAPAEATPATPAAGDTPAASADAAAPAAATAGSYVDFSDDILASTPGTKVLFFHASWCPYCRTLEKDIISSAIPAGLTIFKVDYDNSTALRQRYGVTLQTTVVYVDDNGSELSKKVLTDDPSLAALIAAAP
jgi:thiol-disulfide isomerase/thioredoxin